MTETQKMAAAGPRLVASCGAYRVLVDEEGFQLEKLVKGHGGPAQWATIVPGVLTADLVVAYQKETGLFSPDLMALQGASSSPDSRSA